MKTTVMAKMLSLLVILLSCGTVNSASFDCSKASTPVEILICQDTNLSALDSQLGAVYSKALASPKLAQQVRTEGRLWIREVRDRCHDAPCLETAYAARIHSLSSLTEDQEKRTQDAVAKPSPVVNDMPMQEAVVQSQFAASAPVPQQSQMDEWMMKGEQFFRGTSLEPIFQHARQHSGEYVLYGLLINFLLALVLRYTGHLMVFGSPGDWAVTVISPGMIVAAHYLMKNTDMAPATIAEIESYMFYAYLALVGVITFRFNLNPLFFVISFLAKVTLSLLFYLAIWLAVMNWIAKLLAGSRQERRMHGEISAKAMLATGLLFMLGLRLVGPVNRDSEKQGESVDKNRNSRVKKRARAAV